MSRLNSFVSMFAVAALAISSLLNGLSAQADAISPRIDDEGATYSQEVPNAAFFGKGAGGRMSEASYLRFTGEQCLLERRYKDAYKAMNKAVQLDPGDPTGHVMLARAMSGLVRTKSGAIDEDMLAKCIKEWKLIAYHDADLTEQLEAKGQLRRLTKIAKAIKKERELKEQQEAAQAVATKDGKVLQ